MKQLLPITAVLMTAQAFAATPTSYDLPDFLVSRLSPDGKMAVSVMDPVIVVRDLQTNDQLIFAPGDGEWDSPYSLGNGNCISNTGIVVGGYYDQPAYAQNGEWTILKGAADNTMSYAHGITPDGNVICGGVGLAPMSLDQENTMVYPAVWTRNADGTFGDAVLLPHPMLDFTGRAPQYITAVCISEDGKTIAGQIRDNAGFIHQPIIYKCDEEGKWSYTLLHPELINPDDLQFPPYPGDGPAYPSLEEYMTPEEVEAYNQAVIDWNDAFNAGETDYSTYPNIEDYVSEAGMAAYEAAMEEYDVKFAEWLAAFQAFQDPYSQIIENGTEFIFNSVGLSSDGKYYVATAASKSSGGGISPYKTLKKRLDEDDDFGGMGDDDDFGGVGGDDPDPEVAERPASIYLFNIEDDTYTVLSADKDIIFTDITEDYTVLASYNYNELPQAYIFPQGKTEGMMLQDWVKGFNEELYTWMDYNMVFDILAFDMNTWEEITIPDVMCSGIPHSSNDLSLVACGTPTLWEDDYSEYYTFFLYTGLESGVSAVAGDADEIVIKVEEGVLTVEGPAQVVEIYNVAGQKAYQGNAGVVNHNLSAGVYMVRATAADGTAKTAKVVL